MLIDALSVLRAQLTHDLLAIAKFLFAYVRGKSKLASAPAALVTDQDIQLDNLYEVANEFNKDFVSVFTFEDT